MADRSGAVIFPWSAPSADVEDPMAKEPTKFPVDRGTDKATNDSRVKAAERIAGKYQTSKLCLADKA